MARVCPDAPYFYYRKKFLEIVKSECYKYMLCWRERRERKTGTETETDRGRQIET